MDLPENVKNALKEFMVEKLSENFSDWVVEFDESLYGKGVEWEITEDAMTDIFEMKRYLTTAISKF